MGANNYTAFDLPRTIHKSPYDYNYLYDAFGDRVAKLRDVYGGTKNGSRGKTIYVDGGEFRYTDGAAYPQYVQYVQAGSRLIGQVVGLGGDDTRNLYFHEDQLGSITAVSDSSKKLTSVLNFSPFGERLSDNATVQSVNPLGSPFTTLSTVTRGFTGHEQDDETNLINMRGRIYNPRLARFMTPDPLSEPNLRSPLVCGIRPCKDHLDVNAVDIDPMGRGRAQASGGSSQKATVPYAGFQPAGYVPGVSGDGQNRGPTVGVGPSGIGAAVSRDLVSWNFGLTLTGAQALRSGQAHNRYSYVENNPFRYTDPSGFEPNEPYAELDGSCRAESCQQHPLVILPALGPQLIAEGLVAGWRAAAGSSAGKWVAEHLGIGAVGAPAQQIAGNLLRGTGGSVTKALGELQKMGMSQGKTVEVLKAMYEASGRGTGGVQALADGSKALLSRRLGDFQPILVVARDGVIKAATATIKFTGKVIEATNIRYLP
ncbi:MAG: RHS repeat-associated core domain-containing protein [Polyangiaceae bacterium]|nr:RHS repeat-associated core domain-containing protein [Polyangiaceae bacterium]